MKKTLSIMATVLAVAVIGYAAVEPSTISFLVNFTGVTSPSDVRTAKWVVAKENVRRAALDPVEAPLSMATPADLKASVLTCLNRIVTNYWIESAAAADADAVARISAESLRDIQRAITDQLNAGLTVDQIITRIKP